MINPKQIKVLVVDDEPDIVEILAYNLEKEGYEVASAHDGISAVKTAAKFKPDLILLDIMMPRQDGIETCRQLREIEELSDTYILFLTARSEEYSEVAAFDIGADDYITKPVDPERLHYVMSRWVLFPEEQTAGETEEGETEMPDMDLSQLRELADDEEDMKRLVNMFIGQGLESLQAMAENCTDGPNEQWTEAAHKMKGGAVILNAEKLTRLCDQAQALQTASAAERKDLYDKICAENDAIRACLEKMLSN